MTAPNVTSRIPATQDLTGMTFGHWVVLAKADRRRNNDTAWLCRCACGKERDVVSINLRKGRSQSCGCRRPEESTVLRLKKSWDTILGQQIICTRCEKLCPRTAPVQKYCVECSAVKTAERQAKWSKANPQPRRPRDKEIATLRKWESSVKQRGAEISVAGRWGLDLIMPDEADYAWVRRIEIPFTYAFSKNHSCSLAGNGHVYMRRETKDARQFVTDLVRHAVQGVDVLPGKLYMDFLVQKPNHNGDAINVLDNLSDAIKVAVGLDDRWFSVVRLDWQIVKVEPVILVGLGQKHTEPLHVCSYCGRMQTYDQFHARKYTSSGLGRECKECVGERRRTRPKATS